MTQRGRPTLVARTLVLVGCELCGALLLWELRHASWLVVDPRVPGLDTADAIASVVYLTAALLAVGLLTGTVTQVVGSLLDLPVLVRSGKALLLPPMRAYLERATTIAVAGTIATAAPAAAIPPPGLSPDLGIAPGDTVTDLPSVVVPAGDEADGGAGRTEGTEQAGDEASPSVHEVVEGDHLWAIAEREVARRLARTPTEREVADYWVRLVDANASRLRSGDPDLVFPGEVILLPD